MVEQTAPRNEAHHPNCFQNREAPIPDDLPDDICDCRILWMLAAAVATERAEAAETELAKVKRGAKELGRILHRTLTDALDASGRHDVIDEDGDGDWAVVWETLAKLRPRAEAAESKVRRVEALHGPTSTNGHGPDYCETCSASAHEWVPWPCAVAVALPDPTTPDQTAPGR